MEKALILAAGVGKRLGKLTKDAPKCLLPLNGQTLIDFSLEVLKENDVKEIIIVSGFAHETLKAHIEEKWINKLSFKFIFNEKVILLTQSFIKVQISL